MLSFRRLALITVFLVSCVSSSPQTDPDSPKPAGKGGEGGKGVGGKGGAAGESGASGAGGSAGEGGQGGEGGEGGAAGEPPDMPAEPDPSTELLACAFEPLSEVCGVKNGLLYANECDARAADAEYKADRSCVGTGLCGLWPARIEGDCSPRNLGWLYVPTSGLGGGCQALIGCACVGAGCTNTYPTLGACDRAHTPCHGVQCNGDSIRCEKNQACMFIGPDRCGRGEDLGYCRDAPAKCPAENSPLCGCDGKTYVGECAARKAGTDIDHLGACD